MSNFITILVVMAFAYVVLKIVVLPRLALRRAAKAGQAVTQLSGQTDGQAAGATPLSVPGAIPVTLPGIMQAGRFSGQPFQAPASRPVTCFDMRIIDLSTIGKGDGDTLEQRITYTVSEMLLTLCSRGFAPTLGALMLTDDLLMFYATYSAL